MYDGSELEGKPQLKKQRFSKRAERRMRKAAEAGRKLRVKVLINYFRMIELCTTYQLMWAAPGDKKLKKKAMDKITRELNKVNRELNEQSS